MLLICVCIVILVKSKTAYEMRVCYLSSDVCSADLFLGGLSTNYATNVLFSDNDIMVVEADEFDRSFLTLYPDIAVVTSADADHLDIYGDQSRLHESDRKRVG